ncbi:hypothetical protein niasHT_026540 [Heterodera trifolii]|uniref:PPPDE domain-containing protein n=1 Tax=Heterodera trifolii TaxID=157864 RepID=A0ABD2KS49_9BILA
MGKQKVKANEGIANGNAIEEELSGELARHELSKMGSKVIKDTMFNYYQENLIAKSKVYKWWIRYRYKVNSAICQNDVPINEIRTSFFQYYFDAFSNFNEINREIKKEKPCLAEVVGEMSKLRRKWTISAEITEEEQREFDPFKELPQKFHFANALGLFIHEKQRIRPNPERGIKFSQVGITHKTQWEVQQIFDKFIEVYEENGQFEEGKFGVEKYDYFEHNCVHFAREFVEALMEGDKALECKKWPPKVLRQSHFNKNKYKNLAMCLMS